MPTQQICPAAAMVALKWCPRPLQIIREGRPCHLYFDLEFAVEANPGVRMLSLAP